jgi:hypothetical protein
LIDRSRASTSNYPVSQSYSIVMVLGMNVIVLMGIFVVNPSLSMERGICCLDGQHTEVGPNEGNCMGVRCSGTCTYQGRQVGQKVGAIAPCNAQGSCGPGQSCYV